MGIDVKAFENFHEVAKTLSTNFVYLGSQDEDYDQEINLHFCYFEQLIGSRYVKSENIADIVAAGLYHAATNDGNCILQVSVTSQEQNYKDWLKFAKNYEGATITSLARNNGEAYTAYSLMFPSNAYGKIPSDI